MRKSKILSLTTIVALSFALNGCLIDRIKQRLYPKNQTKQTKTDSNKNSSKTDAQAQNAQKQYTPSKPTAPLYKNPDNISVESKKTVKTASKKKIRKKKHYKPKKIEPEPYSIKKDEQDPELLGPQTTLESNPLSKKSKPSKEEKAAKKG